MIVNVSLMVVFFGGHGYADIYRFRDANGVWHYTNIPSDRRYQLFIKTKGMKAKQYLERYDDIIHKAAKRFGVETNLIKAIIKAESSFNPNAVSCSGAQGLMQLMPVTAEEMEVIDPFDPEENIFGGTKYLSLLLKRFGHDKRLAVAAYNGGPTTVAQHNSVPPIPQTRRFVEKVMKYYEELSRRESQGSRDE
jgi:soluble lytic murein transglycosylase